MKTQLEKHCGLALLVGSALMIFTMVMHPTGGSAQHLLKAMGMIVTVHCIAILAIPLTIFGFWGLTKRLAADAVFSTAGFITMTLALVSITFAAGVNGLAMPIFLNHYRDATPEVLDAIKPILSYSSALNQMFDYVFIGCTCIAILLFSIAIVRSKQMPAWLGYLGIAVSVIGVVLLIVGFTLVNLAGFRMFIVLIVVWIIAAGIQLRVPAINVVEKL